MNALLLLGALAKVSFPGGDVSLLAKTISEATKAPVVFEAGATERSKAFEFNAEDLNALARDVLAGAGFKLAPGAEQVYHHGRLGSWFFGQRTLSRLFDDNSWRNGSGLPENSLNEGKITIQSKTGEATRLDALPADLLGKALQTHWMFERASFKAWVQNMPALSFVNHLAKALGGTLVQRTDRYVLEINPQEIQRRAQATLVLAQQNPQYKNLPYRDRFEIELSRAALGGLSSAQIATALATQGGRVRFELLGSMRAPIQAFVTAALSAEEQGDQVDVQVSGVPVQSNELQDVQRRGGGNQRGRPNTSRYRMIDPRLIGFAEMNSRFEVTVQLATRDALGRQGAPIRLP